MRVFLILAEDPALRQALRAALPESDLPLFESSPDAAARRLAAIQANAVILDDCPGLGARAAAIVRGAAPTVPIIALTGNLQLNALAPLRHAGVGEILPKPFECAELLGALERVARSSPASASARAMAAAPQVQPDAGSLLASSHAALRWIARALHRGPDSAAAARGLAEALAEIFETARCAVLLDSGEGVRAAASEGLPQEVIAPLRLSYASGLMRCFCERAVLLDRDAAAGRADAAAELALLHGELAAPLLHEGEVIGALVAGGRLDGAPHGRRERELLALVARCAAHVLAPEAPSPAPDTQAAPAEGPGEQAETPWAHLASRLAQEIKNPMVAINTFAQLLPQKYDHPDFRDSFSEVVQEEVARINRVVETLFELAEEPRLERRRGDANDTVRAALDTFAERLEARGIAVAADWSGGPNLVEADHGMLRTAIENVIQNAIEAMPGGGKLRVATARANGHVTIRVHDTGAGLAPEIARQVFAPFYSTKERGMGLGLTLAERILRQHHGAIACEAAEEGAAFALTLPAVPQVLESPPGREGA